MRSRYKPCFCSAYSYNNDLYRTSANATLILLEFMAKLKVNEAEKLSFAIRYIGRESQAW